MSLQKVVVVSKEDEIHQLAHKAAHQVFVADDLKESIEIIKTVCPDLILLDFSGNTEQDNDVFYGTNIYKSNIPVVVIRDEDADIKKQTSEIPDIEVYDYLNGKEDFTRLDDIIKRIKEETSTGIVKENKSEDFNKRFFGDEQARATGMVGKSKAAKDSQRMIRLIALSNCNPVLILGETGTGKELAARAIHNLRHPNKNFVAINCAALTANLLESELFGHVKGSFTGAERDKVGLLELADSGTLMLDEISEMPLELQAKLLRVIEEKRFRKVGGTKNIECNATIIAASNRNLKMEVRENRFRKDLYYRLNISPINLAPLRLPERNDDIPLLAEYFLKTSNICPDKRDKIISLTQLAIEALQSYDWPGNVRELRNVIERAILFETTDKIGLNGLSFDETEYGRQSNSQSNKLIEDFSLAKAERELISRALQETGWQKTKAAALLGITRATLYAKVKQYHIKKDIKTKVGEEEKAESLSFNEPLAASVI